MAETAVATEVDNDSALNLVGDGGEIVPDVKKEAERRVQHVRELRERSNELYLHYAEEMFHINRNSLFHYVDNPDTGKKYTSFKDFVESETDYQHRTACYMVQIWEYYAEGFSRDFLENIQHHGWTKLARLVGHLTPKSYESEWGDKIDEISVRDLEKLLKDDSDEGGGDRDPEIQNDPSSEDLRTNPTKRVTFELFDTQEANLSSAMEAAQSIKQTNAKGELLELICLDFLAKHNKSFEHDRPLNEYFKGIEESLGVEVLVFEPSPSGAEIIYGAAYIDQYGAVEVEEEDEVEEL